MTDPQNSVTDKARSILVFAAYHQLASGEKVRDVILEDGKGHKADPEGVRELVDLGALEADGARGRLTEKGDQLLDKLLEAVREAI